MAKKKKKSKRASKANNDDPVMGTTPVNTTATDTGSANVPNFQANVTGPSALKVLSLVELLEPILAQLPTHDLLRAQKVCRTWKATIDKSRRLQQALFFAPAGKPLRANVLEKWAVGATSASAPKVLQNPLLTRFFHAFSTSRRANNDVSRAFFSPTASWRKMLISQPPVINLQRYITYDDDYMAQTGYTFCIGHQFSAQLVSRGVHEFSNSAGLKILDLVKYSNSGELMVTLFMENCKSWVDLGDEGLSAQMLQSLLPLSEGTEDRERGKQA
ncbi:hypothetical protein LTR37_001016 [Vermiconidia calcicola]|uniref:Uncharacterized protein n=1 Tax=Vermiconidia calcicola TaxID=1690605 RepID=A0ACC3NWF6_9PEZI|nr:hypothetical protein LTR37_001016 [Vermiconidia calcicola]